MLKQSPVTEGLVGVLCTKEVCPTFPRVRGPRRPEFRPAKVPQRVLYYYFVDRRLGLIPVRIQTWLPFTVLFAAVLAGDHLPQGFRNEDLRRKVLRSVKTPAERRRHSAAVGR